MFGFHNGKETTHYYPGTKAGICHNHTYASENEIDARVTLLMIIPSPLWNIILALNNNLKMSLVSIKNWINKGHCGTNCQYLKDLSTNPKLRKVYLRAKVFIETFVKHIMTQHYKCLMYFKVCAICSRGEKSQLELTGSLHCDYDDAVNRKTPNKKPQSTIVALYPFNFLHECNMEGGSQIRQIHMNRGHAVVFSSSFCYAGRSNCSIDDQDYGYHLFVIGRGLFTGSHNKGFT